MFYKKQNPCIKQLGEVEVENGVVECNKKTCKLKKCNRGFHRLKTDPSQGLVLIANPDIFNGIIASTHRQRAIDYVP